MSNKKWTDLEKPVLSQPVLDVVSDLGFDLMTPVQAATIPLLLGRKDVSAEAVTGSGKTLSYVVPLIEIIQKRHKETPWTSKEIGGLIISPTRELAYQISEVLAKFLEHIELKHFRQQLIMGGNSIGEDIALLKKTDPCILVCTPGRLEDLFQRKDTDLNLAARVKSLELLILDEADRLLDLGFKATINNIITYLPRQRRTGLFSATQTSDVTDLIRAGLRNPVIVSVKEKANISTPIKLQNFYRIVDPEGKFIELLYFLQSCSASDAKIMIFYSTCACVEYWLHVLPHFLPKTMMVFGIHGKMKKMRHNIVERFRNAASCSVLLCTDVLARGLDIPKIHWVIQWDPPSNAASFVHRVGRTARQGNEGNSLIFLLPSEDAYVKFLKINQKVELNQLPGEQRYTKEALLDTLEKLHQLQIRDRAVLDKGLRAFVSYVRAYTKHECKAILRLKDIDLAKSATGYGLLHLPRMPELRNCNLESFIGPKEKVNINNISYKNVQKEKTRQAKLKDLDEPSESQRRKTNRKKAESWEKTKRIKIEAKAKKELRKAKKERKKQSIATATDATKTMKRKNKFSQDELNELANDLRLFKRLKKNKISSEDFDKKIGFNDT